MSGKKPSSASPKRVTHYKVASNLRYRWGIVGIILAVGFFWLYIKGMGSTRFRVDDPAPERHQVQVECPRCHNDPVKRERCAICRGLGYILRTENAPPTNAAPASKKR